MNRFVGLVLFYFVLFSGQLSAEMLAGHSYLATGKSTTYNCSGKPVPQSYQNDIGIFRTNDNDVYVYFGKDVGVKLDYKKASSGGDKDSLEVKEGSDRYRDTARLEINGDKVTLDLHVEHLTGAGFFAARYELSVPGATCQTTEYEPTNFCGTKGTKSSHRNGAPGKCVVKRGPPDIK